MGTINAEGAKYIDLQALLNKLDNVPALVNHPNLRELCREWAQTMPVADVIPVVRCKDCEFGEAATYGDGSKCVVCWNDYVSPSSRIRTPDWFCAEAVPKEPDIDDE